MRESEVAVSFAITQAKRRGLVEVTQDQLLLGCLQAISQLGIVQLGPWTFDLEDLGIDWLERPESSATKVAYSQEAVALFDQAARIARAEGSAAMRVDHLLAAFAGEETGLMGQLKRRHSITSADWRAAVARLQPAPAPLDRSSDGLRDYLSPEEAAEALGIHVQTLRGYVRSGKLPALRLAGERAIRIRRADLEAVLEPLVPQNPNAK